MEKFNIRVRIKAIIAFLKRREIIFTLLLISNTHLLFAKLITYPIPEGIAQNSTYTVKIRTLGGTWETLGIYNVEVRTGWTNKTNSSMTYFDTDEPVEIEVTRNNLYINKVAIRPLRLHIPFEKTAGNSIRFIMNKPEKISIEIDDNIYNNLHIFARAPESNPISQGTASVTYFGRGHHVITDPMVLESDHTYYIAGGAFVEIDLSSLPSAEAHVYALNKKNITIRGRGVIYMPGSSFSEVVAPQGLRLLYCSQIRVDGITLLKQSRGWTNDVHDCTNVEYNDIGLISVSMNGDGIDIVGSQNVVVKNCFVRAPDDALCVKAWQGDQKTEDIIFQDCVAWNDITSHPIEIGFEIRSPYARNITFRNIDVIHSNNTLDNMGTIDISHGDNARLYDVLFENIYVEKIHSPILRLIDFNIVYNSSWSLSPDPSQRGSVKDVTLRNIFYSGNNSSQLSGYNSEHTVDGIHFENFYYNNQLVTSAANAKLNIGNYVYNVSYAKVNGLIAHWNFDEIRGNEIFDLSPFDNWGNIDQPNRVDGLSGNAIQFNGNKKIEINEHPVMNLSDGQFTIISDIYFENGFTGKQGLLGSELNGETDRYPSIFIIDGNDIEFGFGTGSVWKGNLLQNVVVPGKWYKLIYILDAKNSKEIFYINSEKVFEQTETDKPSSQASLTIGGVGQSYWTGKIDDVKIFDYALNSNEISGLQVDLVGFWSFDDGVGLIANDSTVNKNDGQLSNNIWTNDGKINGALAFTGSQFVDIKGNDALNLSEGNFTVSVWCFFNDNFSGSRPVLGHQSQTLVDRFPGISIQNGSNIQFGFGTGTEYFEHTIMNVVEPGQWQHLAYTLDQKTQTEKFYLNGVEIFSETESLKPILKNRLAIGRVGTSGWTGKIDDVRIYKRALSQPEIMDLKIQGDFLGTTNPLGKIENNYIIYPNPSSGNFIILPPNNSKFHIKISDSVGTSIYSGENEGEGSFNLSNYPKGYYFITISSQNIIETHKMVLI
jgi:hypothetical protein